MVAYNHNLPSQPPGQGQAIDGHVTDLHDNPSCLDLPYYHLHNIRHDDVIKWKHFPRYWPFVRGIPRTKASDAEFDVFFDLRLN